MTVVTRDTGIAWWDELLAGSAEAGCDGARPLVAKFNYRARQSHG